MIAESGLSLKLKSSLKKYFSKSVKFIKQCREEEINSIACYLKDA